MKTLMDSLYNAWIIGTKDIWDALKNKRSLVNILIMAGMVVFFYWLTAIRPFDTDVDVVVYDEGNTTLALESVTLSDGSTYNFFMATSVQDLETKMAYRSLGLILPADFDQVRASGGILTLDGAILWVSRANVAGLETKFSQAFSEILGQPVQVVIGGNVLIPQANANGMPTNIASLMVYFVFWTALSLIPGLMLEEKQTRTMDALLASPASPGQVVLGKALAGSFYVLLIGGFALVLLQAYVVHWGMLLLAFLGYVLLAVGLGLALGSFVKTPTQIGLWSVMVILFLVIPPLFYMESNLKAGIRTVLTWLPSSALASLFRFGCSTGVTPALLWPNLAVAVASIGIVFALAIWKVRRSDR
jgi:ABC-type transport system involved in multi-copper enzyme maturation permease subunit